MSYDLGHVGRGMTRRALAARPLTAWRYRELLPLPPTARVPPWAPGWTPVVQSQALARWAGLRRVLVKDEGRNPTSSFKDRASAIVVARAQQIGALRL